MSSNYGPKRVSGKEYVLKNVAPLAVVGAAFTIISTLISMVQIIIDILKYITTYTIFFTIVFVIGLNAFKFAVQFDVLNWLANELVRALDCQAYIPE